MRRVGIITALASEARTVRVAGSGAEILIKVAGPGPRNAKAATEELVAEGVDGIMSWGVAGGLIEALNPGSLVIGESVEGAHSSALPCDDTWQNALTRELAHFSPHTGHVYSVDAPLKNERVKQGLHSRTRAAIVDMECATIAKVANDHGLAFATLRSIVDPVSFELPDAAASALSESGSPRLGAMIGNLIKKPSDVRELIVLGWWYRQALSSLRDAARVLSPSFALP
ncbi:MAG: hypothetical protein AAF384_06870 [Pseudomonadota bacterium]